MSQDPSRLDDYVQGVQGREPDQTNGLMFEIIARRWLREVVKGYWVNAQNLVVPTKPDGRHLIEIDAFSLTRPDNQYVAAAAEVKWRFHISPDMGIFDRKSGRPLRDIVAERLEKLAEHFNEWLGIQLNYAEVALVSAHPVDGKDRHASDLSAALSGKGIGCEGVRVYDINDMYESVRSGDHPLRGVIAYLKTRYIAP